MIYLITSFIIFVLFINFKTMTLGSDFLLKCTLKKGETVHSQFRWSMSFRSDSYQDTRNQHWILLLLGVSMMTR